MHDAIACCVQGPRGQIITREDGCHDSGGQHQRVHPVAMAVIGVLIWRMACSLCHFNSVVTFLRDTRLRLYAAAVGPTLSQIENVRGSVFGKAVEATSSGVQLAFGCEGFPDVIVKVARGQNGVEVGLLTGGHGTHAKL
jgi:hypothetical protein